MTDHCVVKLVSGSPCLASHVVCFLGLHALEAEDVVMLPRICTLSSFETSCFGCFKPQSPQLGETFDSSTEVST